MKHLLFFRNRMIKTVLIKLKVNSLLNKVSGVISGNVFVKWVAFSEAQYPLKFFVLTTS